MRAIVEALSKVPGVIGCAILDSDRTPLESILQPPYDPVLCAEVVRLVHDASVNYASLGGEEALSACVMCADGYVVVRIVSGYSLVVLAARECNVAMVGAGSGVATLKLQRLVSAKAAPARPAVPAQVLAPQPVAAARPAATSPRYTRENPPPLPNRDASTSGSVSMSMSMSVSWSEIDPHAPADAIGLRVMRHVLKSLMRQIGRQSKIVLENELSRIGATPSSVRAHQFTDLIMRVAKSIPNADGRTAFINGCLGDVGTSSSMGGSGVKR